MGWGDIIEGCWQRNLMKWKNGVWERSSKNIYLAPNFFIICLSSVAADVASHNDKFTSEINLKVDRRTRPWPDLWWLLSRHVSRWTEAIHSTWYKVVGATAQIWNLKLADAKDTHEQETDGPWRNINTSVDEFQCTVHSAQCTMYCVQCTVYNAQWTVYSAQCAVHNVVYSALCTVRSAQCTVQSVSAQITVHSEQCTMYSIQCTVSSAQFTVHNVQCRVQVHNIQCTVSSGQCTVYSAQRRYSCL